MCCKCTKIDYTLGTIKPHIMALRGGGKVQERRKGEKDEGREREEERGRRGGRGRREERERGGS